MTTKVKIDGNSHGWDKEEFESHVFNGLRKWSEFCGIRFVRVTKGYKYLITTREIYGGLNSQGRHVHYRGLANMPGTRISLSNGHISAGHGNRSDNSYKWKPFETASGIHAITKHEFGHNLGWEHSTNPRCMMHPNAPSTICNQETQLALSIFGSPSDPVDPPNTSPRKFLRANLVQAKGSLVFETNGTETREHINGRLYITGGTVYNRSQCCSEIV